MNSANNRDALDLRTVLRTFRNVEFPETTIPKTTRQAGVALILQALDEGLHVLFIQRAEREGDPWSGHVAFPGGHQELSDPDLLQTVIRETREEVGIVLSPSDCVGQLPFEKPYTSDQRSDLVVRPYIFELNHAPDIILNHEVSEVVWVRLEQLMTGELLTHETVHFNEYEYKLPGFRLNDNQFVWGLTYRILKRFCSIFEQT